MSLTPVPCPSVVDDPSTSDAEVADALAAARRDMMMLEDFEPADVAHVMAWAVTRLRARPTAPETRAVEKDDEGRPYQCGAFVSGDSRWECRLESDHASDHEWRLRDPEPVGSAPEGGVR